MSVMFIQDAQFSHSLWSSSCTLSTSRFALPSLKTPHTSALRQNFKNLVGNFLALIWGFCMQNFCCLASKLRKEFAVPDTPSHGWHAKIIWIVLIFLTHLLLSDAGWDEFHRLTNIWYWYEIIFVSKAIQCFPAFPKSQHVLHKGLIFSF